MSLASVPRVVMENGVVHHQGNERELPVDEDRVSMGRCTGFVVSAFRFQAETACYHAFG